MLPEEASVTVSSTGPPCSRLVGRKASFLVLTPPNERVELWTGPVALKPLEALEEISANSRIGENWNEKGEKICKNKQKVPDVVIIIIGHHKSVNMAESDVNRYEVWFWMNA